MTIRGSRARTMRGPGSATDPWPATVRPPRVLYPDTIENDTEVED